MVTIDNQKAIENVKTWLEKNSTPRDKFIGDFQDEKAYSENVPAVLSELVGKKVTEVPCLIPVSVTATDEALRSATLSYVVFFEIKRKDIVPQKP